MKKKSSSNAKHKIDDDEDVKVKEKIEEEQREQGSIKWETILSYLKSASLTLICVLFLLNLGMQATRSLIDFWLRS